MSYKLENLDTIVALAKRRGVIFPSSEIYGGLTSCYDYGPAGVELKRNIKDAWWRNMVTLREDVVGLDTSIIMHTDVWKASGHIDGFTDPLIECADCKMRVREDSLQEINKCKITGRPCRFGKAKQFNLMFKTHLGSVEDSANVVYLRPETAQGIFVNFSNVMASTRVKIPFGIAQQGKSFRNEITTRHFTFRTCEFEQMEMEFFCAPNTDEEWFKYWKKARMDWFKDHGIRSNNLRFRDHSENELAHYSKACTDIEYLFPFGWSELEGIAHRGCYDLSQHSEASGKKLEWVNQLNDERFIPHVIEPALGTDRALLAYLCDAYEEEKIDGNSRTVLHFHPRIAPFKVAIFPLIKKGEQSDKARQIYIQLREHYSCQYDETGNIGRRYRRQDEIGTPFCITVDHQTMEDNTVTIRDRDDLSQDRVYISELRSQLEKRLSF